MLTFAESLSMVAIGISLASFSVSSYTAFRDRAKLKISSKFFEASEYGPGRVVVSMVNVGRRPVILRMIGGSAGEKWSGEVLDQKLGGKRLGEHERYEHAFDRDGTMNFNPDGEDLIFEELWVEDSLGVRHPIPDSSEYISRLWK